MKWFEKEYTRRFKNARTKEGVDEDQLWENIMQSPELKKSKWNKSILVFILMIGLIGASLCLYLYLEPSDKDINNQISTKDQVLPPHSNNASEKLKELNPTSNQINKNTQNNVQQGTDNAGTQNIENKENELKSKQAYDPTNTKVESGNRIATNKESSQNEINASSKLDQTEIDQAASNITTNNTTTNRRISKSGDSNNRDTPNVNKSNSQAQKTFEEPSTRAPISESKKLNDTSSDGLKSSNSSAPLLKENKEELLNVEHIDADKKVKESKDLGSEKAFTFDWSENLLALPSLSISPLEISDQEVDLSKVEGIEFTKPIKNIKKNKFSFIPEGLTLNVGTNTQKQQFNSSSVDAEYRDQLQKSLNTELGKSVGLDVQWMLSNSLFLSSGIQWTQTEHRFESTTEMDTTFVRSNGSVAPALAIRNVRNHNKFEFLSIPLELGYRKRLKGVSIGLSVGAAYNLVLKQEGKILNVNDEIVSFDQGLYMDNFISFRLKPSIAYHLSKHISLSLNVVGSLQSHKESTLINQKFNSIWWNPNIGFNVKF